MSSTAISLVFHFVTLTSVVLGCSTPRSRNSTKRSSIPSTSILQLAVPARKRFGPRTYWCQRIESLHPGHVRCSPQMDLCEIALEDREHIVVVDDVESKLRSIEIGSRSDVGGRECGDRPAQCSHFIIHSSDGRRSNQHSDLL